jgi:hypothetical protein
MLYELEAASAPDAAPPSNEKVAAIREVDPALSLHYWDWNQDPHSLFTLDFMGAPDGSTTPTVTWVPPGRAKASIWRTRQTTTIATTTFIRWSNRRPIPARGATPFTPTRRTSSASLKRNVQPGVPPIGTSNFGGKHWSTDTELTNAATFADFDDLMQGFAGDAHGLAHGWIGGNLSNQHMSFRDPFVYLLHSNVDRAWAMWQTQPGHPERLDPNQVSGSLGSDPAITVQLQPWAGTGPWPTRPWYMPENQQQVKTSRRRTHQSSSRRVTTRCPPIHRS